MPQLPDTSPAFKTYVLQQKGLSPDNYDLTDDGQIISRQQSSPSIAPSLSPAPSQESDVQAKPPTDTSIGGTLLHSAEGAAFPTATGLGAAAGASAMTPWIAGSIGLAPETMGASLLGLAVPALAAMGGGWLGSQLQSPLESDAFKQQQAAEQQQHGIASTFGSMIPSLPFFNPLEGIKNIPKAAGAAYELALGRVGQTAASTEANQALRNALIGGGLQGGQDVYSQMQGNQPFNYGQLATSVGGGALLNEPWGLGKMLFPSHAQVQPDSVQAKPQPVPGEMQGIQSPEMEQGIAAAHEAQQQQNENFENTIPGLGDWKKTYENQVEDLEKQRDTLQSTADDVNELVGRRTDALSQIEDLKNKINLAKGEPLTDEQGQVLAKPAESGIIPPQETPSEVERGGSNEMPSKTTTGMFSSTVPAESAVEKAMNKTTRYQEEPATQTEPAESQPVNDNDPLLLRNASPEYRDAVQQLAAKRGVTLKEAIGLLHHQTGNEVLGRSNTETREALVNPNLAELDTPMHEIGHPYLDDLANSANPKDRALYQRGLGIFGGDARQADEAVAGQLGVRGVPRIEEQLHGYSLRQFKSWFGDYVARWKNTLGVASDEDVLRHLSARQFHDAPYGTRSELNPSLRYTGFQPGMAGREGFRMYTATDDIKDKEGNVLVPKDSTVSDKTLESKGINYQEHSSLLRPTDVGYNDLTPSDKDEYARLHGEAMVARKEHEVGAHEGTADNLIDKELSLKKFSEARGMKYQEEPNEELRNSPTYKQLPITRSAIDTMLAKDGPRAEPVAQAVARNANLHNEYASEYKQSYNDATKSLSDTEKNHLEQVLWKENANKKFYPEELNPRELDAYTKAREGIRQMQEDRIEANQPVKGVDEAGKPIIRQAGIDPHYWPNQISPKVLQTLHEGDSPESAKLREEWDNFQMAHGMTPTQSRESLDAILGSYSKSTPNLAHFRGVDVEQGHGLPESFMRPGLDRNMDRYINRFSSARAYHDAIESDPKVASLIGEKTTPWGDEIKNPERPLASSVAKDIIGRLKGQDFNPEEGNLKGAARIASATMLGPQTNIHVLGSTVANTLGQAVMPKEVAGMVTHMVSDFRQAAQHAIDLGNIRQTRPMFKGLFDAHATTAERLNIIADGISRLQGRNLTDYVAKATSQAANEWLVGNRIELARTGDKGSVRFMQGLDPSWSADKVYSDKDKIKLAGDLSNRLHGVHDSRTQPNWMLKDNIVQPFTSLMGWSVAQTNNFMKHVITPAAAGDYRPLIMNTLGAVLGGYIIKQGREALANRKSPIPSFNEIAASPGGIGGHIPLDVYNLLAMTSFAGYGGIMSMAARSLFDIKYKNPVQGSVFPLDEALSNTFGTVKDAATALMNSHDLHETTEIALHAGADLMKGNVQGLRIAMNWAAPEGLLGAEKQRQFNLNQEEGDLRRWKTVEGMPTQPVDVEQANPYLNMNRKVWQRTPDIQAAAEDLPNQIKQALDESNGNMDVFRSKLQALKNSSYPSMPSIEHTPRLFFNYVDYLNKTEGPEAASKRVTEYMLNNAISKVKSSMVPNL